MSNGLTTSKLQTALNNYSACLNGDGRCEFDSFENPDLYLTDWEMYQYCSSGSNLLTEDICHHWFTHSMYREDNNGVPCTDKRSDNDELYKCKKSDLNNLLTDVCDKYPYHPKCECVTGIKGKSSQFSFDIDTSKIWPTHCLYPACSKTDLEQRKQSSLGQPFLPSSVLNNKESCPSTICTIDMKGAKIDLGEGGKVDISNYCSNFGKKDDDEEEEYLFMIGEFKVTALYLVIGIIIFLLIILFIIIIILSVKKGNSKRIIIHKRNK